MDRLCQAVAWAVANKQTFTRLVDEGIAESGLGDAVSRMGKRMKIRGVLRDALRQKSVGIIEEIPEKGIVKYGKPAGIVACIVPTTNPDLTPAGNAIYGIKARDVVIFSPHPRSKKTSFETVRLMREALEREGAPADILQCLTKVNIPMSQALMARADLDRRHRRAADGPRGVQLRHAGVRRRVRQLDDDHRRDGQHRGSGAQYPAVEDLGLRLRLLGGRQPHHRGVDLRQAAGPAAEGRRLPRHAGAEGDAAQGDVGRRSATAPSETVAIAPQQLAKAAGFTIPADRKFIIVHGDGIGKEHHLLRREADDACSRSTSTRASTRRSP